MSEFICFRKSSNKEEEKESKGNIINIALSCIGAFASTLCSFIENHIETGVNSVLSFGSSSEFMPYLKKESAKQVFEKTKWKKLEFEEALMSYRNEVKENFKNGRLSEENQKIGRKIMSQPLLNRASHILSQYIPKHDPNIYLSTQFELDRKRIAVKAYQAGQGILHREGGKLCGELGMFFDPHRNGNIPFLLGTRTVNGSKVNILRHPVPTIEWGGVKISEEYRAFLESCRSKKEKVLYCCLLNLRKPREVKLIQELRKLESEYKEVFHFVRMPLDGPLIKADNEKESLEVYRKRIEMDVRNAINPSSSFSEFIFGSDKIKKVVFDTYRAISNFAYDQIREVYQEKEMRVQDDPHALRILLKEKKQAFMMLFSSLLRTSLIKKLKINHYSNTCKDAIDRGAAHLMSDLLWETFLTNAWKENHFKLRVIAAWPAFMAKTQPIIKERAEWLISLARWAEGASELGLREKIVKEYSKQLQLYSGRSLSFNY